MNSLLRKIVFLSSLTMAAVLPVSTFAQVFQGKVANLRAYDKSGINVFEGLKVDTTAFTNLNMRLGAGFTQEFQGLKHKNSNNDALVPANKLYGITPGFNTAMANLFLDAQLADGIRLDVTLYLSTRHHNETWVKGGYIQFDKLPFKGQFWSDLMKYTTIKVGHMEINYGDQHFRRTDAGNAIYNPFTENYILDAFATEIGGEVYVTRNGFFGMVGITNGMIKGNVDSLVDAKTYETIHKNPSLLFKAGLDRKLGDITRIRLSGSFYHNNSDGSNTLYGGDRAGSSYFMVMEKTGSSYTANETSGRLDPKFSNKIDAYMANGFVKVKGLELFGTYETSSGRNSTEKYTRKATQFAVDGLYRFGKTENFFIGARYNTVKARLLNFTSDVTVNRYAASAGWFLTQNILLKGEYVTQQYKDFPAADYRNGGKFYGYTVAAVVGF